MKIWQIFARKLKKYENLANFDKDIKKYENLANYVVETKKVWKFLQFWQGDWKGMKIWQIFGKESEKGTVKVGIFTQMF